MIDILIIPTLIIKERQSKYNKNCCQHRVKKFAKTPTLIYPKFKVQKIHFKSKNIK
jgi:hypothetical protein